MDDFISFVKKFYDKIHTLINKGHGRSVLAKKNIIASFFIKGTDKAITLLLVPLVLGYLDQTKYGIWLTLISIIAWFEFMDVGLGHGLRTKFALAKANGNHIRARKYVSTTYCIITLISSVTFLIFWVLNNFLKWDVILNVEQQIGSDLSTVALIVFGFFTINFLAKLITTIVRSDQRPAISDAINLIGKIFILIGIYILTITTSGSLVYLSLVYSGLPVLTLAVATFFLFRYKYEDYKPSYKYIDLSYAKSLMGLGWKYFIIQISLVIILSTDNIIISHLFNPKSVTPYQIANKYFSIVLTTFMIIVSPLWSATSEAFVKNDLKWIQSSVRKLTFVASMFVIISILMLLISKTVFKYWVGAEVEISYLLSFFWMLFAIIGMYNGIYFSIINGAGKIKVAMYVYIFAMVINIPLSIFFAKYLQMGIEGVILATIICQSMHLLYLPFQYRGLVLEKDSL